MKRVKQYILKFINRAIVKEHNSIFFSPLENCMKDKYDLINYSADTVTSLLNYWMDHPCEDYYKIYLIIFDLERISYYNKYVERCDHLDFQFVPSYLCFTGLKCLFYKIINNLLKFKCKIWVDEQIPRVKTYAVKGQRQVVLGYFASCKSNYIFDRERAADIRQFTASNSVTVISTSHFDSMAKSAAFGVPLQCFAPFGLTRNDNMRRNIHSEKAKIWLDGKKKTTSTKVILYVPTFRDYESKGVICQRSIWGRGYNDKVIERFLRKRNIIVIAKLHSWQNEQTIFSDNNSIIRYESNYEFTLYDLMKEADVLITDYSSIGYDWLFIDKPLIYNLWDLEVYRKERGLAYEPYERMCAGEIVDDTDKLISAIDSALVNDPFSEKRKEIKDLMFTVQDHSSNKKVLDLLKLYLDDVNI